MSAFPTQQSMGSEDKKEKNFDSRTYKAPVEEIGRNRRKKSNAYHFCLPENILGQIKEIEEQPPKITGFSISRLMYLISIIVTHRQDEHPGAYSVLNMQYLNNIVPRAGEYLVYLKSRDIIEWIPYSTGRNSRLYRITRQYNGRIVFRTITDNYLIGRIEKGYKQIKPQNSNKYPFLNRFVKMVEIDKEAAFSTIEQTYEENPDKVRAEARRSFSIGEVLKIAEGLIYKKVNSTNHRYDTNYTRLLGELVKHLTIKGKPLVELDISNSQPFLAVCLFNPSPAIQRIIGHRFTMYARNLHMTEELDAKLYTYLVTTGKFYDFMMEKYREFGIPFVDKDDVKEQIFTVFFGKNNSWHYSPAVRLFANLFPNVYRLFVMIKKEKHNRLAIILQRIEAFIMLDRVATRINQRNPEIEFITKHDSILPALAPDEAIKIKKLMEEEISGVVGYVTVIRIKN